LLSGNGYELGFCLITGHNFFTISEPKRDKRVDCFLGALINRKYYLSAISNIGVVDKSVIVPDSFPLLTIVSFGLGKKILIMSILKQNLQYGIGF